MDTFDWLFWLQALLWLVGTWLVASNGGGNRMFRVSKESFESWPFIIGYALGIVGLGGIIETLMNVLHWDLWLVMLVCAVIVHLVHIPFRIIELRRRDRLHPER